MKMRLNKMTYNELAQELQFQIDFAKKGLAGLENMKEHASGDQREHFSNKIQELDREITTLELAYQKTINNFVSQTNREIDNALNSLISFNNGLDNGVQNLTQAINLIFFIAQLTVVLTSVFGL